MRKFIVGLAITAVLLLTGYHPASAQTVNLWCWTGSTPQWQPCSAANPLAVNASVSASITGFPGSTQTTGTPISVTSSAGGVTGTLPAGTVVVASNVGATNNAYCKLGASATVNDQMIPPNSWFGFTVGTNTQLTCITSTSTTTVNMVGGAGLPTGAGGGAGGSGSNASVGSTGSAVPGSATYAALNVGGNLTGFVGKAASTAATATDVSLVTNESPNSQLSAAIGSIGTAASCAAGSNSTLIECQYAMYTAIQAGTGSFGSAFPSTGIALGLNGPGGLRGWTAVNPSGSIYAGQVDLASIGGTSYSLGPVAPASAAPTVLPILSHASTTAATGTSLVAKASAGHLDAFNCTSVAGGGAGFCVAYNGSSAPATGALTGANVLDFCYFDTTARGCSLAHINGSVAYGTGIVILVTSAATPYTYTTGTDTAAITVDYD